MSAAASRRTPVTKKRPHAYRTGALTRTVTIGSLAYHTHPSYTI